MGPWHKKQQNGLEVTIDEEKGGRGSSGQLPLCDENGNPILGGSDDDSLVQLAGNNYEDTSISTGTGMRTVATNVTKKYDTTGKGYLDPTERELRNLDTENKGYFRPHQVLGIMQSLQNEQARSSELLDSIRREHQKAVGLKRLVILLACFSLVLAISNIGTSFAAAKLVQDMRVTDNGNGSADLVSKADGQRVGTTSKTVEITLQPPVQADEGNTRHRKLVELQEEVCGPVWERQGSSWVRRFECQAGGSMDLMDAIRMYQAFCPNWHYLSDDYTCEGDGSLSELSLNCRGQRTQIFRQLPATGPVIDNFGWEFMIFPSDQGSYVGKQTVYYDAEEETQTQTAAETLPIIWPAWAQMMVPRRSCEIDLQIAFYCFTDLQDCALFATWDMDQCPGLSPSICGPLNDDSVNS